MKKIICLSLVLFLTVLFNTAMAQEAADAPPKEPVGAAPQESAGTAPKEAAGQGITIARMEFAGGIEEREPVNIAASFPATQEKVWCFVEFQNISAETTVAFVWTLGENEMARVPQTIKPSSRYRTWSSKVIAGMKGNWKVDILDEAGTVLKSAEFKIE